MLQRIKNSVALVRSFFSNLGNVYQLYKRIWSHSKVYVIFSAFMIFIETALLYSGLLLLKLLVDELSTSRDMRQVMIYILIMSGLSYVFKLIINVYNCYKEEKIELFKIDMIFEIQRKTMSLSYQQIEDPNLNDNRQKAMEVFYPKQSAFMNITNTIDGIRLLVTSIVQLIGIVAVLALINPLIFVALIITCIISSILSTMAANKEFEVWNNSLVKVGRQLGYFQELATNFSYAKEMRINKLQRWISEKMYSTAASLIKGITLAVVAFTIMGLISGSLFIIQDGGIYLYLARLATTNKITIGDFTVYVSAVISFISIANTISVVVIMLHKSGRYIKTFLDYLEIKEEQNSTSMEKMNGTVLEQKSLSDELVGLSSKKMNIRFSDVWFKYPGQEEYILKGINLEIKQGNKLVIVGENGAGKTTLIKLLLRLYQPTRGAIYLNEQNINQIDFKEYMKQVSAVFQDFNILSFSVIENIIFDKEADVEHVSDMLREVGLKDFIDSTDKGILTQMGKQFDDTGIELSGGQQQKLAISRALFKDTGLVILDEPTAMLSPKAEYEIYLNFSNLTRGKTAIYISHRMSCCRLCDYVAVLEQGEIVEYGTHEELMKLNGLYTKMFDLQAEFYRELVATVGT